VNVSIKSFFLSFLFVLNCLRMGAYVHVYVVCLLFFVKGLVF